MLLEQPGRHQGPGVELGVTWAAIEPRGRTRSEDLLGQHTAEQRVHAADRVADTHRKKVSVVLGIGGELDSYRLHDHQARTHTLRAAATHA